MRSINSYGKVTELAKVRGFVQKIDVDSAYRPILVLYVETFNLGIISDLGDREWPVDARETLDDMFSEEFKCSDEYSDSIYSDIFEIVADYHGYATVSYEGEHDWDEWFENVKIHKLTNEQKEKFPHLMDAKSKLLDSLDD